MKNAKQLQIKILCSTHSHEAIALAVRLSGELVEHTVCDRGHILSFSFSKAPYGDSYKEQFAKAVVLYPEFIEVIPMNPFLELIELKKQESALAIAIKNKQQEALDWHFSGEDTKQLTGKVAEIDGASVTIKLVTKKPTATPKIKAMLDRAAEIEKALRTANKQQIFALESQIGDLSTNEESLTLISQANQLLSSLEGEVTPQIAITLPKGAIAS